MISRRRKILRICQAHVAPGMSLDRWHSILAAHGVHIAKAVDWDGVSDDQVSGVFGEIAGIVKAARAAAGEKVLQVLISPKTPDTCPERVQKSN